VYFAGLAEQQAANAARKEALCAQAESLSQSTDWVRTAEAVKALQGEWKSVGPAPRTAEKALWERFHAACDAFFSRRREDLQRRKEEWSTNLARKEALCAQAEVVAESTDWAKGIEEIKRLQAEWKTIGPVRKAKADAVWARFRAACDMFFERYQGRDQAAAAGTNAEAEKVLAELSALLPAEGGEAGDMPAGLAETIADLRGRWAGVASRLPRERNFRMSEKWAKTISKLVEAWPAAFAGTDLDPEANVRAMEELCVRVEGLLPTEPGHAAEGASAGDSSTPATLLARQLREALATNTIGGRQDDSAKWKTAAEQARQAQAEWRRIGPVPDAVGRALTARFQRALQRVQEQREQQRRVRV
jgi:hypothetical protein